MSNWQGVAKASQAKGSYSNSQFSSFAEKGVTDSRQSLFRERLTFTESELCTCNHQTNWAFAGRYS